MKNFYIVWLGQLISSIGSGLTAFALGIYIFKSTGSAANYSLIILAAFLPALLLKPIGGTLSDRVNRRRLMMIGDLGSALGLVYIIAMIASGNKDIWPIYVGAVVSSCFLAFQNPAYKASVTDLVHKDFYSRASGLMQLAEVSKFLISPVLAGLLLKLLEIQQVLMIDVISFLLAAIMVFWIKPISLETAKGTTGLNFFADLKNGFGYLFKNKGIMWLLCITSMITFFIGLVQALLGPMILAFSSSQALGISQSISASGMFFGSIFMSLYGKSTKKMPVLSLGLVFCGICLSLLGFSSNIIIITLWGFLFFLFLPGVNTSLDVLVRCNVENEMQGRIWSIVSLISQLGMAIAFGVAGYLADNIFNPLLQPAGMLSSTVGFFMGTGAGRGIGLMFMISGMLVTMIAILMGRLNILKSLDITTENRVIR